MTNDEDRKAHCLVVAARVYQALAAHASYADSPQEASRKTRLIADDFEKWVRGE
jgi:hypothetical protein